MSIRDSFKLAKKWISDHGGKVVVVPTFRQIDVELRSPSNDHFGCDWHKFEIYMSRFAHSRVTTSHVSALIHQAGHVFACKEQPINSAEWLFLGWEYHFARMIGMTDVQWFKVNADYTIEQCTQEDPESDVNIMALGEMSPANAYLSIARYVALARENGLIVNNLPVAIREKAK